MISLAYSRERMISQPPCIQDHSSLEQVIRQLYLAYTMICSNTRIKLAKWRNAVKKLNEFKKCVWRINIIDYSPETNINSFLPSTLVNPSSAAVVSMRPTSTNLFSFSTWDTGYFLCFRTQNLSFGIVTIITTFFQSRKNPNELTWLYYRPPLPSLV